MKLLTDTNPKLIKGIKFGYLPFILHLAPANLSGFNVCPKASPGCSASCLNTAGRGRFDRTQDARIRKTRWYMLDRVDFLDRLRKDIKLAIKKAARCDLIPCIRLNGTSDVRWESTGIIETFPDVQFYDYTKISNRRNLPVNYHLTFSLSESNDTDATRAFKNGMNVAVVFKDRPTLWKGRKVIDGDISDLRFTDPTDVYVGLKAKGLAKTDLTGFVR